MGATLEQLSVAQRRALQTWLDELQLWQQRVNLSTVTAAQGWSRHIGESQELLRAAPPPMGARVADLGSGAGVPGIPLAVLRPDLEVTLVEADRRRAGFLLHVTGVLGLRRVTVVAVRAEDLAHGDARETFDVVVSRATAPPAALCELGLPLVRLGGWLAALVAKSPAAARQCARAAHLCGGADPVAVGPGVLRVDKRAPTPPAYPRRSGIPTRRPLR